MGRIINFKTNSLYLSTTLYFLDSNSTESILSWWITISCTHTNTCSLYLNVWHCTCIRNNTFSIISKLVPWSHLEITGWWQFLCKCNDEYVIAQVINLVQLFTFMNISVGRVISINKYMFIFLYTTKTKYIFYFNKRELLVVAIKVVRKT